eukprot:UN33330
MTRFKYFSILDRKRILLACCASAVSCLFGFPLGGWMFACEVTRGYFSIHSYWTAFSTSIIGNTLRYLIKNLRPDALRFIQNPDDVKITNIKEQEYLVIFVMAIVLGLLGVLYIKCLYYFRRMYRKKSWLSE